MILFRSSLSTSDVVAFTRNLSVTMRSGIPLVRALELFEEKGWRPRARVIRYIREMIEGGKTLSDAMETSPYRFPDISINLVRAGELEGQLESNMAYVSEYMRQSEDLKRKIQRAMVYPGFILFTAVGLILAIGTFVLPQILPLFDALQVELPMATRILITISNFFEEHGAVFSIASLSVLGGLWVLTRVPAIRPFWDRLLLTIPLVRKIQVYSGMAQMGRTMGLLIKSGVPIREAISVTSTTVTNSAYVKSLRASIPVIENGQAMSRGLERNAYLYPKMSLALLRIGEETGTLGDNLQYMADFYEAELDYVVKDFITILEPLLLLIIGVVVGSVVYSIIMPIYQITGTIG